MGVSGQVDSAPHGIAPDSKDHCDSARLVFASHGTNNPPPLNNLMRSSDVHKKRAGTHIGPEMTSHIGVPEHHKNKQRAVEISSDMTRDCSSFPQKDLSSTGTGTGLVP